MCLPQSPDTEPQGKTLMLAFQFQADSVGQFSLDSTVPLTAASQNSGQSSFSVSTEVIGMLSKSPTWRDIPYK